jgi:dTDP-4-amino-4,6-dideoxygalactose transaminase
MVTTIIKYLGAAMKTSNVEDLLNLKSVNTEVNLLNSNILLNKPMEPNFEKVMGYIKGIHGRAWYTNFGELHDVLTQRLSQYLGVKNLLLVNNGTTALQVASKVLQCKSAWTTPYSFAATSSALNWQGIPVHYSDIELDNFSPDCALIESVLDANPDVNMLLPAHIYGSPCDIDGIQALAEKRKVKVLYDAAQCFGVTYKDRSILSYGDASIISFHATKLFHSIEGGAICFKNEQDYLLAKQMINFGFNGEKIESSGINGKLNEYQAAVGLTLLDDMDAVLQHRTMLFERYRQKLEGFVGLQQWSEHATFNGGYMPIVLPSAFHIKRVIKALADNGVQSRVYFKETLHRAYGNGEHCPNADTIVDRALTLPLHYYMTENDIDKISDIVIKNA